MGLAQKRIAGGVSDADFALQHYVLVMRGTVWGVRDRSDNELLGKARRWADGR